MEERKCAFDTLNIYTLLQISAFYITHQYSRAADSKFFMIPYVCYGIMVLEDTMNRGKI